MKVKSTEQLLSGDLIITDYLTANKLQVVLSINRSNFTTLLRVRFVSGLCLLLKPGYVIDVVND